MMHKWYLSLDFYNNVCPCHIESLHWPVVSHEITCDHVFYYLHDFHFASKLLSPVQWHLVNKYLLTVIWIVSWISCHACNSRKGTVANLNIQVIIDVMSQSTHDELAKFGPSYIAALWLC